MATDLLVDEHIHQGARLLQALDNAKFPVSAAFWYRKGDTWTYMIASPVAETEGPRGAYTRVNEVLRSDHLGIDLWNITAVSPQDLRVQLLREVTRTGPREIGGTRFTARTINRVFVEDAYIYRMA